jgi:DNA-binding NtrC family response regulator
VSASEQVNPRAIPKSRGERILFVDDDPSVGTFMRQALEMLDYVVVVFDHPIEALEHFTSQSYDYDLVITDMGLPRINGIELAQRIQKIAPGIPTILLTGSNESPSFPALAKAGIRRVVTKPITCRDLSIVVRDVLDMNRSELETA